MPPLTKEQVEEGGQMAMFMLVTILCGPGDYDAAMSGLNAITADMKNEINRHFGRKDQ